MDARVRVKFPAPQEPPILPKYIGWRCLHEAEGGYDSDSDGMPEIRPSFNAPPVKFNKDMQLLSWHMNNYNDLYTVGNWRATYGDTVAFTNGNGFNNSSDPRADYVTPKDTDKPLPKLMKAIICGGMFIRGMKVGNQLVCYPGVHAIDGTKPIPSMDVVMANNWWFVATTQYNGKMSNFPQGHGSAVYIPYILTEPVPYPIEWFVPWVDDALPDPLKIYLTKP